MILFLILFFQNNISNIPGKYENDVFIIKILETGINVFKSNFQIIKNLKYYVNFLVLLNSFFFDLHLLAFSCHSSSSSKAVYRFGWIVENNILIIGGSWTRTGSRSSTGSRRCWGRRWWGWTDVCGDRWNSGYNQSNGGKNLRGIKIMKKVL